MWFEWDDDKAETNWKKHGVTFEEAATVFYDLNAVEIPDEEHSDEESRYIRIGLGAPGLLFVVYTDFGADGIRIIHARYAEKKYVKLYEKKRP